MRSATMGPRRNPVKRAAAATSVRQISIRHEDRRQPAINEEADVRILASQLEEVYSPQTEESFVPIVKSRISNINPRRILTEREQ